MHNPFNDLNDRLDKIERIVSNIKFLSIEKEINNNEELLSVEQASKLTRLTPTTLYSRNSNGTIPIISSGTPVLYKREEIMEWLENGKKLTPRLKKLMEDRKIIKI